MLLDKSDLSRPASFTAFDDREPFIRKSGTAETSSDALRVAVLAAFRNSRASPDRIPRRVRPFDSRRSSHFFAFDSRLCLSGAFRFSTAISRRRAAKRRSFFSLCSSLTSLRGQICPHTGDKSVPMSDHPFTASPQVFLTSCTAFARRISTGCRPKRSSWIGVAGIAVRHFADTSSRTIIP